jgi:hypothetical protein
MRGWVEDAPCCSADHHARLSRPGQRVSSSLSHGPVSPCLTSKGLIRPTCHNSLTERAPARRWPPHEHPTSVNSHSRYRLTSGSEVTFSRRVVQAYPASSPGFPPLCPVSISEISRAVPPGRFIYYSSFVDSLRIELNIALFPEQGVAERLTAASRELAEKYPAVVRLGDIHSRLSLAPHLTLYQMALPLGELPSLDEGLRKIASTESVVSLACTSLAYNVGEASLEARTEMSAALAALQARVIDFANPLRDGTCWSVIQPEMSCGSC